LYGEAYKSFSELDNIADTTNASWIQEKVSFYPRCTQETQECVVVPATSTAPEGASESLAEGGFSFFDLSCSLAGTWHLL
jgi:hypothetical protein